MKGRKAETIKIPWDPFPERTGGDAADGRDAGYEGRRSGDRRGARCTCPRNGRLLAAARNRAMLRVQDAEAGPGLRDPEPAGAGSGAGELPVPALRRAASCPRLRRRRAVRAT